MFKKILTVLIASTSILTLASCAAVAAPKNTTPSTTASVEAVTAPTDSITLEPSTNAAQSTPAATAGSLAPLDTTLPLTGVSKIEIDYDVATIEIKVSDSDQIKILETTDSTDESTYGRIYNEQQTLKIKQILPPINAKNINTTLVVEVPSSFAGVLDVEADVADITVAGGLSVSQLEVSSDVGNIVVDGQSTFKKMELSADVGNIELTLPADLSFAYDVSVDAGVITSDFFTAVSEDFVGQKAEGRINNSPTCAIDVECDTGNITIKKA